MLGDNDYRVIALKIALDDTASKVKPWALATEYFNFITTGDPNKAPVEEEKPERKKPGPKPGTKYKKRK